MKRYEQQQTHDTGNVIPSFRAMAIVALQPTLNTSADATGQQFSPAKGNGFYEAEQHSTQNVDIIKRGSGNTDLTLSNPLNFGWKHPLLTRLGMYHPLEVGNITFPKERLGDVLERLRLTFQRLSLQAMYNESPIAASCLSLEHVELRVSLWQSRQKKEQVILEIQRRSGDSIIFWRYSRSIRACVGFQDTLSPWVLPSRFVRYPDDVDQVALEEQSKLPPTFPWAGMTINMPLLLKKERLTNPVSQQNARPDTEHHESPTEQALNIANQLLCNDRFDARQFGLESLCILTNRNKVGLEVACKVAKTVLRTHSPYQRMQAILFPLAITGRWPGEDFEDEDDSIMLDLDDDDDDSPVPDKGHLHAFLALQVLSQASQVLAHTDDPHNAKTDSSFFLVEARRLSGKDTVEALLEMVHDAPTRPHLAYLATQCLIALCHVLPDVRHTIDQHSTTVEVAEKVGSVSHAALETASKQLKVALQA